GKKGLAFGNQLRDRAVEDQAAPPVAFDANDAIGIDAGDPDSALAVEGEAVGKFTGAKGMHGLARTKRGSLDGPGDGKARNPLGAGLIDVQPATRRVDAAFVAEANAIGNDVRACSIVPHNKAIGMLWAERSLARIGAGRDGDPFRALGIDADEIAHPQ